MSPRSVRLMLLSPLVFGLSMTSTSAADVQADFDFPSSTLSITVDDPDNDGAEFVVAGFPLLGAAVIGMGDTTVNGAGLQFFVAPLETLLGTLNVDCTLTDDDDEATFVFILGNNLSFDLGGGNDSFALVFSDAEVLDLDGGDGFDSAFLLATSDTQNITSIEDLFPALRAPQRRRR